MTKYFVKVFEPLTKRIIVFTAIDYIFYKRCLNALKCMSPFDKKFYVRKLLKWLDTK